MCYNARMKWMLHSFWALPPMLLLGRPPVPAALPPVAHADTEMVTNVPFTASLDAAGRFRLSLACLATPTNNVEAAVDGASAFAELGAREPRRHELAAGWLYRREWNMVKLTGRGLEGHGEAFAVQVLPDAVVIRFR